MSDATIWGRLSTVARRMLGRPTWPPGGLVLVYHRIAEPHSDPQRLAVSPAHFRDHLEILSALAAPMTLTELVDGAGDGRLPRGAVALTFDDGYADNLHVAMPLLQRLGIPATIFVATGTVGRQREFWWDELERVLLGTGSLPARLRLPLGGAALEWHLGTCRFFTEADRARYADWTVDEDVVPTPRHRVYLDLCRRLRRVGADAREKTLDALAEAAGTSRDGRSTRLALSEDELVQLSRIGGLDLGAHTVSHPSLAHMSYEVQRQEMAGARRTLEAVTGREVRSLAYPFGGRADVSHATTAAAAAEGMTIGCTTAPGSVRPGVNPLRVPRVIVRNWSKDEFLLRWRAWTGR